MNTLHDLRSAFDTLTWSVQTVRSTPCFEDNSLAMDDVEQDATALRQVMSDGVRRSPASVRLLGTAASLLETAAQCERHEPQPREPRPCVDSDNSGFWFPVENVTT